jgi:release factor glutamine methyltransferase
MTALEAVHEVARELETAGVPSPRVDAEHLVAHVLGVTRSGVYSSSGHVVEEQELRLRSLLERRRAREPLAYVLGEWGFRRLTLRVDKRALVPRPETEVVVERCLEHLRGLEAPQVLDVGVGSGAIALSLADEHPGAHIVGVDASAGALTLARENLADADVDGRIQLRLGNLLQGLQGPYDLVVSNPPYVSPDEYATLQPEIRLWEPREALVGVGVGEAVARGALDVLRPGGWLVLECGDGQAPGLAAELRSLGYEPVATLPDLAGRDRVVEGRCPPGHDGA